MQRNIVRRVCVSTVLKCCIKKLLTGCVLRCIIHFKDTENNASQENSELKTYLLLSITLSM